MQHSHARCEAYPTGWHNDTVQEGTYTNEEVLEKVTQQPCGDACFLKLDSEEVYGSIDWDTEPEVETLDAMLKLAPNTLPCSLSTLFPQTDCYKVRWCGIDWYMRSLSTLRYSLAGVKSFKDMRSCNPNSRSPVYLVSEFIDTGR